MADGFKWVWELLDRFSRPMRMINDSVRDFDRRMTEAQRGFRNFVGSMHDALGTIRMLGGALASVGGAAVSGFKFALGAAAFKEDTMIALETMLRSKEQAKAVFDMAIKMAADTPLETEQTLSFAKQFVMQGTKGTNDIKALLMAVADVGGMHGLNPEKMNNMMTFFGRIQSAGKLTALAMSNLTETGTISEKLIFEGISKETGIAVNDMKAQITAGAIDTTTAIRGTLRAIAEVGGGQLGMLSAKASNTLTGIISRLKSRPLELMMRLDESKGFESVKGFIGKLADMLDPTTGTGKSLVEGLGMMFSGLLEGILGPLQGGTLESKIEGLFKTIATTLKETDWKAIGRDIRELAEALIAMVGAVVSTVKAYSTLKTTVGLVAGNPVTWFDTLFGKGKEAGVVQNSLGNFEANFKRMGRMGAEGMAQGLAEGAPLVEKSSEIGLAMPAQIGVKRPLGMQSPSLVMKGLGRYASEGFQLGLNGQSNNKLAASLNSFVSSPPTTQGAKGGMNVSFNINANMETAEKIRAVVVEAMTSAFDGIAIEAGVA